jgi:hypothetical protein
MAWLAVCTVPSRDCSWADMSTVLIGFRLAHATADVADKSTKLSAIALVTLARAGLRRAWRCGVQHLSDKNRSHDVGAEGFGLGRMSCAGERMYLPERHGCLCAETCLFPFVCRVLAAEAGR